MCQSSPAICSRRLLKSLDVLNYDKWRAVVFFSCIICWKSIKWKERLWEQQPKSFICIIKSTCLPTHSKQQQRQLDLCVYLFLHEKCTNILFPYLHSSHFFTPEPACVCSVQDIYGDTFHISLCFRHGTTMFYTVAQNGSRERCVVSVGRNLQPHH